MRIRRGGCRRRATAQGVGLSGRRGSRYNIDVEGAEVEVVEGGDAATWDRIRRAAIEHHDLFRPDCCERVSRALEGHGFRVEVFPDGWDPRLGLIRASR